jgi:hypothetical protein
MELYLAVQNVSKEPIRLSDTKEAPESRTLYQNNKGMLRRGMTIRAPSGVEATLEPGGVAMLQVFATHRTGLRAGSLFADVVLKDGDETLVGKLNLEHAKDGTWKGKLATGETTGAAALANPEPDCDRG